MEIRQKLELRRFLAPEMQQSLNILAMHLLDLNQIVEQELVSNPLLEEATPEDSKLKTTSEDVLENIDKYLDNLPPSSEDLKNSSKEISLNSEQSNLELAQDFLTKKVSLQDILLRQLGMFVSSDEDLRIGQEIIGNIDDNGYLKATLEEIAQSLNSPLDNVEKVLRLIQKFEPAGVAARTISECLLIQLDLMNDSDPLLRAIIENHLENVAKKNYSQIAKALKEPLEKIEPLIKKITKLNPKPGRNYSIDEAHRIIPDIIIDEKNEALEVIINNEYIPHIIINKTYRDMLKQKNLDPQTREFLTNKLRNALELIKALAKRESTLRRVVNAIVEIQQEAIKEDLSLLKPLTFNEVANKLQLHESTICRVVMNKYVETPCGIIALKSFFSSHVNNNEGQSISSTYVKGLIKDLIDNENKKHPLSDMKIMQVLSGEKGLKMARRTVAKYREELKFLSSTFRKER